MHFLAIVVHSLTSGALFMTQPLTWPNSKKSTTPSNRKGQETTATLAGLIGLEAEHLVGYAYGGLPPHSPNEHVMHPNALVIHNHEGLEVLDLNTGQPLTQLSLPDTKAAYVDMDNDKASVEIVKADYGVRCRAEVSTAFPRIKVAFLGPLCESPTVWGRGLFSGPFNFGSSNVNEDTHLALPPLVVDRWGQNRVTAMCATHCLSDVSTLVRHTAHGVYI